MKSSCIKHPAKERLIIIREWQIDFCKGNKVAASLVSFFEYWHNIKLEQTRGAKKRNQIAKIHGEEEIFPEHTLQYHTLEDLEQGILGIGKRTKIKEAREMLRDMGVISEHKNPNKKYRFDQTIYYQFHPEICSDYILRREVENDPSPVENNNSPVENGLSVAENDRTITETTPKTSLEIKESVRENHTHENQDSSKFFSPNLHQNNINLEINNSEKDIPRDQCLNTEQLEEQEIEQAIEKIINKIPAVIPESVWTGFAIENQIPHSFQEAIENFRLFIGGYYIEDCTHPVCMRKLKSLFRSQTLQSKWRTTFQSNYKKHHYRQNKGAQTFKERDRQREKEATVNFLSKKYNGQFDEYYENLK